MIPSKHRPCVVYIGASDAQIQWGGNDDPRDVLVVGTPYTVLAVEEHSWHTKIELQGFEGLWFNDASFEPCPVGRKGHSHEMPGAEEEPC